MNGMQYWEYGNEINESYYKEACNKTRVWDLQSGFHRSSFGTTSTSPTNKVLVQQKFMKG